ncbi:MAG: 5'/3'-nucleotidase SurE, partial [Gammaproteobacteria bacterium]|nr:5'/3'-nucleotidase SurE [Gammaproteobacteria bacterium]
GRPAVAVSLVGREISHYADAAQLIARLIDKMLNQSLPSDLLLNINIPDLPREQIGKWEITRL